MIREHTDRVDSYATTRGCVTHSVNDVRNVIPGDSELPSPRMPREMRVETNGLMWTTFSHAEPPSRVNPGLLARGYNTGSSQTTLVFEPPLF